MQRKGWFAIPGMQDGERSLQQQLRGLEPMLDAVRDRGVLDLGCAEGLIAQIALERGARNVLGIDSNPEYIAIACGLGLDAQRARFMVGDLNGLDAGLQPDFPSDIVLALAVLHKLRDPQKSLREMAAFTRELLVIRLPRGSSGVIHFKHGREKRVNSCKLLPELGFALERDLEGPNAERVHYWRRNG